MVSSTPLPTMIAGEADSVPGGTFALDLPPPRETPGQRPGRELKVDHSAVIGQYGG